MQQQWAWIDIKGPDAKDFLHRLTTLNLKTLPQGQGNFGFFLAASGKIRAQFTLWHIATDHYVFELDSGKDGKWKKQLLETIEQFTFSENFKVTPREDLSCAWEFPEAQSIKAHNPWTTWTEGSKTYFRHSDRAFNRPWITLWGPRPEFNLQSKLSEKELESLRIQALYPAVDSELTENSIPLEIGLKDGISENKGCYPGQEVIERIISLGSPARRLGLLIGTGTPPNVGEKLFSEKNNSEAGEITSLAPSKNGFIALGMIKKIFAEEGQMFSSSSQKQIKLERLAPYA